MIDATDDSIEDSDDAVWRPAKARAEKLAQSCITLKEDPTWTNFSQSPSAAR